ncbi:hypothetical protein NX059_007724 [Plenodomus lindquistii]|nr:hypothetical protein NX059_007724 [Plenodomus lindquistii]
MLQQYALQTGLLDAKSVPFGMSPAFLEKDPNTEQHFLRIRGHPFGRYENHVPFFRGIPPYIVHFFFIQTVMTCGLDISDMNIERPDSRVVVQVLVLLHQAIEQRSRSLPPHINLEPKNTKQSFAKLYRDGQAKIIHSIREELESVIHKLRTPIQSLEPARPHLLSIADALADIHTISADSAAIFQKGVQKHNLHDPQDGNLIWTLLLTTTLASWLSLQDSSPATPPWLTAVLKNPLPALEDGIEDAETYSFLDEHFGDFFEYPGLGGRSTEVVMERLDDLGLTLDVSRSGGFVKERTENLSVRLVMWGMGVAERDVLSIAEGGGVKKCLVVGGDGGEWVYGDAVDV